MGINKEGYFSVKSQLDKTGATLVAVSKTKPVGDIRELYELGQRDFGENYVQELTEKAAQLPGDIRWHFIGHLQTNKVKLIAPFVQLIHGVDSLKGLKEISKQGEKFSRVIDCLLQVHIATEETKFGLNENELAGLIHEFTVLDLRHIRVCGLMGMASFTDDHDRIRQEFRRLRDLFEKYRPLHTPGFQFQFLSMGMSSDYLLALEEGSNMIRIGSLLFGERTPAG